MMDSFVYMYIFCTFCILYTYTHANTRTYLVSLMKATMSVSRFNIILRSPLFLFKVLMINSSRFVPVESVYGVSKLESRDRAGDVPLSETVEPCEPSFRSLCLPIFRTCSIVCQRIMRYEQRKERNNKLIIIYIYFN